MRVCYLGCHEAGLCCYLVMHIGNLLTSITAVLLPFVTYFLTLLCICASTELVFTVSPVRSRRLPPKSKIIEMKSMKWWMDIYRYAGICRRDGVR
jgi:hypothetical protein